MSLNKRRKRDSVLNRMDPAAGGVTWIDFQLVRGNNVAIVPHTCLLLTVASGKWNVESAHL